MSGRLGAQGPPVDGPRRPGRVPGGPGAGPDAGAVTAELAMALPAVVLVLGLVLATGSAAVTQLRCVEGARAAARVAALGEPDGEVVAAAQRVAGRGATADVRRGDPWVEVVVSAAVPGGPLTAGLRAEARATAWVEP